MVFVIKTLFFRGKVSLCLFGVEVFWRFREG